MVNGIAPDPRTVPVAGIIISVGKANAAVVASTDSTALAGAAPPVYDVMASKALPLVATLPFEAAPPPTAAVEVNDSVDTDTI
jgi:hypothetical protein